MIAYAALGGFLLHSFAGLPAVAVAELLESGTPMARQTATLRGPARQLKIQGLDKAVGVNRIGDNSVFMEPICEHSRTVVIARRDGVDYVQCVDCRQIFEAEDLESVPVYDDEEQTA